MKTIKQLCTAIALCGVLVGMVAAPVVARSVDSARDTDVTRACCNNKVKKCCKPTLITQRMVNEGLVIRKPGVYEFCSNIEYSPGTGSRAARLQDKVDVEQLAAAIKQYVAQHGANFGGIKAFVQSQIGSTRPKTRAPEIAAITIATDDVYIDMKNFKLEQGDSSSGVVGFYLVSGLNNVTIVNGTVAQFTGAAVHSFIEESDPQIVTSNLSFSNLNLLNNCPDGIANGAKFATGLNLDSYLDPFFPNNQPDTFLYSNVVVENCSINHNGIIGFIANNIDNIKIQNTQVNDTYSEAPGGFEFFICGLVLSNSRNISVLESSFNNTNNGVSQPFTIVVGGILQVSNSSAHFNGCQFNSTSNVGGVFVVGSLGAQHENYLWENCQFNGIRSVDSRLPNAFHCSDQFPSSGQSSNKFVNCQFNDIQNDGGTEYLCGLLYLDIKSLVIEDCQFSKYRNNESNGKTFGIYYQAHSADAADINVANMECCRIKNTTITDFQGEGFVAGIMFLDFTQPAFDSDVSPELTNVLIEDCQISKIHSSSDMEVVAGICNRDNLIPLPITSAIVTLTPPSTPYNPVTPGTGVFRIHFDMNSLPPSLLGNNMNLYYFSANGASNPFPGGSVNNVSTPFPSGPNNSFLGGGNDAFGPYWDFDVNFMANYGPGVFGYIAIRASDLLQLSGDMVIDNANGTTIIENNGGDVFTYTNLALPFIAKNFVIDSNVITDVMRTGTGDTTNVAGIYLDSVTNPVITNNTIIATTNGILFTNHPESGLPVTNNGLVQQNRVTNCSVAGYVDTSDVTTSAWVQNVSYLNGVSYVINPLPGIQTGYAGSNVWYNIELP